jgi:dTDP-4-dehydrorhamnose reductase
LDRFLFVVGAHGFVGSHVKEINSEITTILAKQGDWAAPISLPKKSTILFLRAISSPYYVTKNPIESDNFNVSNTSKYIDQCIEIGHRVVFSSSDTVYGERLDPPAKESDAVNPIGLYSQQKNRIEKQFSQNPHFLSVRFSVIVGENSRLRRLLMANQVTEISDPVLRNPVGITHVISLIKKLTFIPDWEKDFDRNIVNFGGDSLISMWELANIESKRIGSKPPLKSTRDPIDLIARPGTIHLDSSFATTLVKERLSF